MQLSNIPGKLVLPFANAGGKSTIPVASQIGITAGAASLTDGFPPLTRTPIAAGGVPPSGLDMNGILYEMSAIIRWANAGGGYPYDSTFATDANVGGYPKGARIMRSDGTGYWFNAVENNATDPEAAGAAAAGWLPDYQSGATSVAMSGSSVTLTPNQYGKPLIVITGTLSANLNLIFPALAQGWTVINNATGGYSITAKTASGSGVTLGTISQIVGDGTNMYAANPDSLQIVTNVAILRNIAPNLSRRIQTKGYYTDGDDGDGQYFGKVGAAPGTYVHNGASIIVPNGGDGSAAWLLDIQGSISVKQAGAKGIGSSFDDRPYCQAALNVGVATYFPKPSVAYYLSDQISPGVANQLIYGDGQATSIQLKDGSVNGIYGDGIDGVTVRDLEFSCASLTAVTAYKGAVVAHNCRNWTIERIAAFNMAFWGVALFDSSHCTVRGCRFSTWFGTQQDSADISVYNNSNYNLIEGNYCYGSGDHGILVQDPYTNSTPTGNVIIGNHVGEHNAYGIAVYVTTAYNTKTTVIGNDVRDIIGTQLFGASGAGIFIQSAGGSVVSGNNVSNCCRSTTNFETLGMAGISVTVGEYPSGTAREVVVSNNRIDAPRGPGIYAVASNRSIIIDGNAIDSTGTANVRGEAIIVSNCVGAKVVNNAIRHINPNYYAIQVLAITNEYSYPQIANNIATCVQNAGGILFSNSGGGFVSNAIIAENQVCGNLSGHAYNLNGVRYMRFVNNHGENSGPVFHLQNCLRSRFTGNRLSSGSGGYGIVFTGTNTGSVVDESNDLSGTVENDAGSGVIISQYGSAAPAGSGLWNAGDRVIQSVPVVGNPKGWRCTVAGNPGTWVSEGNL